MDFLSSAVSSINDVLWSYVLIAMLIGLGLWFTVRTGFVQIFNLKEMSRVICEGARTPPPDGHISPFQAFCISTASRVGVGNIAGIAIAVVTGGPGAIFWMWVIATIGAASGFVESTLAQVYKIRKPDGKGFMGGPAYYIKNALGSPFFATVFALLISVTYGLIFNSVQSNTMTLSIQTTFGINPVITGIAIAILTALVIFGGMQRIAKVVAIMVPFMAGAYLLLAFVITIMNITQVPAALALVFTQAFNFEAAGGAAIGTALMTGIKRGLFSNEAGMGAVPNAAAAADASHPVKQGLIQSMGVYFDTLFVCTASAMLVLLVPGWEASGKTGIALVQYTVASQLGEWTNLFITIIVLFFAFSSIIGNYFYGEMNMPFISKNPKALQIFRALVVIMVFVGSIASLSLVWDMADLFMALMAIVNLVAITMLGKIAFVALEDYNRQRKQGIRNPVFDASILPNTKGVHCWKNSSKDS